MMSDWNANKANVKKAIIFTYCRSYNFGANLQGYSLQRFIRELGWDCKVIDIRTPEQIDNRVPYRKDLKGLLLNVFTRLNQSKLMLGRRRFNAYHYDLEERIKLPCIGEEPDMEALNENPPEADVYISGSDQVFSPSLLSRLYFLDFEAQGVRYISYAASVGVDWIPETVQPIIATYLKRFCAISVREEQASRAIQPLVQMPVQIHVDPVVLTSRENWEQEETPYEAMIGKKYILAYFLYRPKGMNRYLKELHKKTGFPVVLIDTSAFRNIYHQTLILDAGPREFLWLIHNAEMVVTSSFHGTMFSLIYRKDFAVFNNLLAPARIDHVLKLFGVSRHGLLEGCSAQLELLRMTNEEKGIIQKVIERETRRSREFLLSSMEGMEE